MKPSTHSNAEPSCGETVGLHVLIKKQKNKTLYIFYEDARLYLTHLKTLNVHSCFLQI